MIFAVLDGSSLALPLFMTRLCPELIAKHFARLAADKLNKKISRAGNVESHSQGISVMTKREKRCEKWRPVMSPTRKILRAKS